MVDTWLPIPSWNNTLPLMPTSNSHWEEEKWTLWIPSFNQQTFVKPLICVSTEEANTTW